MDDINIGSLKVFKIVGDIQLFNKILGYGSLSQIYLGYYKNKENASAVKIIKNDCLDEMRMKGLKRDVEIMEKGVNIKNIIKLYNVSQTGSSYYVCREFYKYDSLENYLREKERTTELVLKVTGDVFEAFRFLFQNSIIHRNIKPKNLVVDEYGTVKIKGFSNASIGTSPEEDIGMDYKEEILGIYKLPYLTPEHVYGYFETDKSDIFAIAIVIYEAIFEHHPFFPKRSPITLKELYDKYFVENPKIEFPERPSLSENYKNMMRGMLKIKESERFSWSQVFELFEKEKLSKEEKVADVSDDLSSPQNITSYHPHDLSFKKGISEEKWTCNALSDKGICRRNHTKVKLARSHSYYECEAGCNFKLCDLCGEKYRESKLEKAMKHPVQSNLQEKIHIKLEDNKIDLRKYDNKFLQSEDIHKIDYEKSHPILAELHLMDDHWIKEKFDADIRLIGKGGFGKVFRGRRKGEEKYLAIKILETIEEEQYKYNLQEIYFLERLKNCYNIMSYERTIKNEVVLANGKRIYQIFIEMELATSNLHKVISEAKKIFEEPFILSFFGQILNGLSYAHSKNCSHLDLKPANLLLVNDIIKIADWGGSLLLNSNASTLVKSKEVGITQGWAAPEITCDYELNDKFNYYSCDVYSLGMLMFYCCGISINDIRGLAKNKKAPHDGTIKEFVDECIQRNYSKGLAELLEAMTKFNPKERPHLDIVIDTHQNLVNKL